MTFYPKKGGRTLSENHYDISRMSLIFKVRSVSPERQIPINDLGLDASELPKEVKSFLKENVIPSEELRPFGRMRRKCELDLMRFAVKNDEDKMWVFNPDDTEEACNIMLNLEKTYESAKALLKNRYPIIKSEVLKRVRTEFEEYDFVDALEKAVAEHQPTWEYIEKRLQFYFSFRPVSGVTSPNPHIFEIMKRGEQADKENLYHTILKQTAEKSEKILNRIFDGEKLSHRTIESVSDMQFRIHRLSFLDERLKPLATGMKNVLDAIPKVKSRIPVSQPRIPVSELGVFTAMITLLSDEERLVQRLNDNKPLIFKAPQQENNLSLPIPEKKSSKVEVNDGGAVNVIKGSPRSKRSQTGRLSGLTL